MDEDEEDEEGGSSPSPAPAPPALTWRLTALTSPEAERKNCGSADASAPNEPLHDPGDRVAVGVACALPGRGVDQVLPGGGERFAFHGVSSLGVLGMRV